MTPIRQARRSKILMAARTSFLEQGYRNLTMEGFAEACGMSKATLYSYFDDKQDLFAATIDDIATDMAQLFARHIKAEGTVRTKIKSALVAKHGFVFALVRKSHHAPELFRAKDAFNKETFARLDQSFKTQIADLLEPHMENAGEMAAILFDASQGIANAADSVEKMDQRIASLVDAITPTN